MFYPVPQRRDLPLLSDHPDPRYPSWASPDPTVNTVSSAQRAAGALPQVSAATSRSQGRRPSALPASTTGPEALRAGPRLTVAATARRSWRAPATSRPRCHTERPSLPASLCHWPGNDFALVDSTASSPSQLPVPGPPPPSDRRAPAPCAVTMTRRAPVKTLPTRRSWSSTAALTPQRRCTHLAAASRCSRPPCARAGAGGGNVQRRRRRQELPPPPIPTLVPQWRALTRLLDLAV